MLMSSTLYVPSRAMLLLDDNPNSCTNQIINAGIKKVIGMLDYNKLTVKKGLRVLKKLIETKLMEN